MVKTIEKSDLEATDFHTAIETGEIIAKSGYHQPGGSRLTAHCGCDLTTAKGAYRDVSVKMPDGRIIHYYHQSPIVVEGPDGRYRLDSHGYRDSSTTKERINRHAPATVFQRDFTWYVGSRSDDDPEPFEDGMVIE